MDDDKVINFADLKRARSVAQKAQQLEEAWAIIDSAIEQDGSAERPASEGFATATGGAATRSLICSNARLDAPADPFSHRYTHRAACPRARLFLPIASRAREARAARVLRASHEIPVLE